MNDNYIMKTIIKVMSVFQIIVFFFFSRGREVKIVNRIQIGVSLMLCERVTGSPPHPWRLCCVTTGDRLVSKTSVAVNFSQSV